MTAKRIVVVGVVASDPYAGMAWMHMQIVAGLRRLGHDAYYFEITSAWPYDPVRQAAVCDSDYALRTSRVWRSASGSPVDGRIAAATRITHGSAWNGRERKSCSLTPMQS